MKFLKLVSLFLMVLLTGCAISPTKNETLTGKNLQGLFSVITPDQSQSGHFIWTQNGNDFKLLLYGPLGLGATRLQAQGNTIELKTSNGQEYWADSAEDLMNETLGWSMPVSGFLYWLWGKPDPTLPYQVTRNNSQEIVSLNQEGWLITYTWAANSLAPKSIVLTQENINIKIFINE